MPILNDLRSKNVMPIICGGTNYYIESLIWKILIEDETKSTKIEIPSKKSKISVIEHDGSNNIGECEYEGKTFDTKNEKCRMYF